MAGRGLLYKGSLGSNFNTALLQNHMPNSSSDSFFLSAASPFLGSRSMVSFEDVNGKIHSERMLYGSFDQDGNGDEDFDEYFHQPEKKRRLKADQIQFLEKSFEVENKLEPERKIQLAKDLGLQPRQVAIWFQNRRARWKTKSLERDYEVLQNSFNSLKANYENLLKEKEKLKVEVIDLTDKLLLKEKEEEGLKVLNKQSLSAPQEEHMGIEVEGEVSKNLIVACKQEDLNSVKSDVLDSDSPHYTDGVHSSHLEPCDSSHAFDPDQSDLSQDEEDNLSKLLLPSPAYMFPKIGDMNCPDLTANSCYYGSPIEEDQSFGFWAY